ncbi:MAG TPA: AAA-like domain-containing protein [Anaerolineae bacterium]|nr:AAA-like domain-containing protein [Anaerolineae bacterium]
MSELNEMMNPFVFTTRIQPDKFIGRKRELLYLLNTTYHGGSNFVTGQPRIGKSSLLLKLQSEVEKNSPMGDLLLMPVFIASSNFSSNDFPRNFWQLVSTTISESTGEKPAQFDSTFQMQRYFERIGKSNKRVILLIDGLGGLLGNDNFDMPFWGSLRSIASTTRGLSVIAFSRLRASEAQEKIEKGYNRGSPMLNFAHEMILHPLSHKDTLELVEVADQAHKYFTPKDKHLVWELSGGHPFIAQLAASIIWDARMGELHISKDNYRELVESVVESATPHFWDTWRYLSPVAQTLGIMAVLQEIATYRKFNTHDIKEAWKSCREHTRTLESIGLIRTEDEKISISSLGFGMWILRHQIGPNKDFSNPEEWLRENRRMFGPVTQKQLDDIINSIKKLYSDLRETALDLGEAFARVRLGIP